MEDEEAAEPTLREGHDFASTDELRALTGEDTRKVCHTTGERLAEAIEQEVRWLRLTGQTPGGLPWDGQPAWRVRLWEHLIEEQERAVEMERMMTAW